MSYSVRGRESGEGPSECGDPCWAMGCHEWPHRDGTSQPGNVGPKTSGLEPAFPCSCLFSSDSLHIKERWFWRRKPTGRLRGHCLPSMPRPHLLSWVSLTQDLCQEGLVVSDLDPPSHRPLRTRKLIIKTSQPGPLWSLSILTTVNAAVCQGRCPTGQLGLLVLEALGATVGSSF